MLTADASIDADLQAEQQLQGWIAGIVPHDASAEAAFNALYAHSASRLYALALRISHDAALAEEIVEDSLWQVWRQAPRFDPQRGSARAWLTTITRSRALDALRARDPAELHAEPETLAPLAHTHPPPDLLAATQDQHQLHQALTQLDAQSRQLIALAFFRGLTHEEIAHHNALPLGTVKSLIRRALIALQNELPHLRPGTAT